MMNQAMKEQKRQGTRYQVALPVEFRTKQKMVAAHVANIGSGGMCIKTSDVLPVKSHTFFHIVNPNGGVHYNIEAEVIWSQPQSKIRQRRAKRPGMMGLRFVKSRFFTDEVIHGLMATDFIHVE